MISNNNSSIEAQKHSGGCFESCYGLWGKNYPRPPSCWSEIDTSLIRGDQCNKGDGGSAFFRLPYDMPLARWTT